MTLPESHPTLPLVAVVGRPNVGKSSLVNRVLGRREAIVEATPGVTRDRHGYEAEWAGHRFEIVDTGGLEPGAQGLETLVREQAELAIQAADVVVMVVDIVTGPLQEDAAVARILQRSGKPVVVAANKADEPRSEADAQLFLSLGLGSPCALSALHGRGSGDFLDAVVARLPPTTSTESATWAAVAVVGRPNVGKSSLLNALTGERRALVDSRPGTTRDPVDSHLLLPGGESIRIVDTAGMRRAVRIDDPLEYFSLLRAQRVLERVDVALLIVDADEGVTGHDQRIAEEIASGGRACVIAMNKWDLAPDDPPERLRLERSSDQRLRFMPWARRIRTSALSGRGLHRIGPALEEAVASHRRRLGTSVLNNIIHAAQESNPHPRTRGSTVRVYYGAQVAVSPPTVLLFTSAPLSTRYVRFLEGRIRAAEPFHGSALTLRWKLRNRRQLKP